MGTPRSHCQGGEEDYTYELLSTHTKTSSQHSIPSPSLWAIVCEPGWLYAGSSRGNQTAIVQ